MFRRGEPFAPQSRIMLRFDRYLVSRGEVRDVATGRVVRMQRTKSDRMPLPLFHTRGDETLIDCEASGNHRVEIWEWWIARSAPQQLPATVIDFAELLEVAKFGAPRAFDLPAINERQDAYMRRALAREARVRGWIPIALDYLTSLCDPIEPRLPAWLDDRSLVLFVDVPSLTQQACLVLLRLARRDARPHVVVRTLRTLDFELQLPPSVRTFLVHEEAATNFSEVERAEAPLDAKAEAESRWQILLEQVATRSNSPQRRLQLAHVLIARDQLFEARALLEPLTQRDTPCRDAATAALAHINERAAGRAAKGWEMVDDFIDVLHLCQDIEDEQTALARVGAFVRDRLQASSVAFIVREGCTSRVLARIGSTQAAVDLAVKTIETGLPVTPARPEGPVEAACPVRHANDVIGALWCRWSAGMPVAPTQAATLLGIAAAASAPSVRLALAKAAPLDRANPVPELVGESAQMSSVRDAILRAAASPFPVVIEGESGSGKELAARAIHARSGRRDRRFCAINCAALVDDLVEAELFGYVRGAFTGATTDRPGVFEDSHGGTLFLDEVAELGPRVQAKLLRVLQEGEVRRVGESMVRRVDVRIVAATNRPLAGEVEAGTFRADLWYRLDVIRITMPPLRERIEDLPVLVNHLWRTLATRAGSRAALAPATISALAAYNWPGNIRELQNVLASILVSAPRAGLVGPSSLPTHIGRVAALDRGHTLADARRQFEERYVRAALARAGGRLSAAAKELGVSRQGLSKLMGRLGIDHDTVRPLSSN